LYMGNIAARRDSGHARDHVEMQWLLLHQHQPEDFVIATGQQTSVRDFIDRSAKQLGITLRFEGKGTDEKGIVDSIDKNKADPAITLKPGDTIVAIDPRYYRPAEVETLLGDPSHAKTRLGWEPRTTLDEMIEEMVASDLATAKKNRLLRESGYEVNHARE
ncbi:MAG: GDP-mannose 4,6-dehydratase, partial [Xanthomonadales bacterium]|nr:GDP-mannose 4,6-dehydratase [Xanthomonadales bacterium]